MNLIKNNPHWPDHADFNCPKCNGAIEDVSDYDYGKPPEDFETQKCPHCGEKIEAKVDITWKYIIGQMNERRKL